jgi:hypothetical protein
MILYRIIQQKEPSALDFSSQLQLGNPCSNPATFRECAEGVSAFDSLARAARKALKYPNLGNFVVEMDIPDESEVEVRQTMQDRHHYTIYMTGAALLQYVVGEAVPVEEHRK